MIICTSIRTWSGSFHSCRKHGIRRIHVLARSGVLGALWGTFFPTRQGAGFTWLQSVGPWLCEINGVTPKGMANKIILAAQALAKSNNCPPFGSGWWLEVFSPNKLQASHMLVSSLWVPFLKRPCKGPFSTSAALRVTENV